MLDIFRGTVVASVVLFSIWFLLPHMWQYIYSDDELNLLKWTGYGSFIENSEVVGYIFAIIYLVLAGGLYFFRSWARKGLFVYMAATIILSPAWGIAIQGGYDILFGQLVILSQSFLLFAAYFTSISNKFT
jgi:hypothetical protein